MYHHAMASSHRNGKSTPSMPAIATEGITAASMSSSEQGFNSHVPSEEVMTADEGHDRSGSSASSSGCLIRELEEVRKLLPASMIQACNTSFVQVIIM